LENEQKNVLIETRGILKEFGVVTALDSVDVQVKSGEILGLIGENGSGKSTLTSILAGIQPPTAGEMLFKGEPWKPVSMTEALNNGVGMIVQESGVIAGITIAENITLGEIGKFGKFGMLTKKMLVDEARLALDSIGVDYLDPNLPAFLVDMQDRKIIEIAKVWAKQPELFVVDETTTAISQRGRDILYDLMERQKNAGKSVIFISHELEEVINVCTRITVLRDGKVVQSVDKSEFDIDLLKMLMIGRELEGHYYRTDYDASHSDEVVLSAKNISGHSVKNLSLDLHKGEILGIGGMSHCGMHSLGKMLFGALRVSEGEVLAGDGTKIKNVATAMDKSIGYASKDRDTEALMLKASVRENVVSAGLGLIARAKMFIFKKDEKTFAKEQIDNFQIKCHSDSQFVAQLSGGNKQKVVFGKWIGAKSKILILDCPTRGVDVGVKQSMYQLLYRLKQEGYSIVMISEELAELIGMSDRLIIMKDGGISKEFERSVELSESQVIHYMV